MISWPIGNGARRCLNCNGVFGPPCVICPTCAIEYGDDLEIFDEGKAQTLRACHPDKDRGGQMQLASKS